MKSVLAVLLFTFIKCVVNASVIRRQIPDIDPGCAAALTHLSSKELQCVYGSAAGSGYYQFEDDNDIEKRDDEPDYGSGYASTFERLCTDPFCSSVYVNKVIPKCRVSVLYFEPSIVAEHDSETASLA